MLNNTPIKNIIRLKTFKLMSLKLFKLYNELPIGVLIFNGPKKLTVVQIILL